MLRAIATLSYPFFIFGALHWLEPRTVAIVLAASLALRGLLSGVRPSRDSLRALAWPVILVGLVLAGTLWWNDSRYLLFVPAGVNAALLVTFARTLRRGSPMIEVFARLQHSELSSAEIRHCRRFTAIWCAFFAVNGAIGAALAIAGELRVWTLYTGLLSYLGMGCLLVSEFAVRSWRFGRSAGGAFDPALRWIFPKVRRDG